MLSPTSTITMKPILKACRELRAVDLKEISIVSAWPAYDQTVVHARSRPVLFPRVARALRYLDTV
jgi:hypothetical protein